MDNQNQQPNEGDSWMDELFTTPDHGDEILPDEQAMSSAGLTHPEDMEIDRIIQETLSENWGAEQPEEEKPEEAPEPFRDEEYRDAFGEGEALEQIFSDAPLDPEPQETEVPEEEEEVPKGKRRPKRKEGYGLLGIPHVLVTLIWAAIVLVLGVSLGRVLWLAVSDVLAFGRGDQPVNITIDYDDTLDTVSQKLHDAGLVKYPELFKFYVNFAGKEDQISVGSFTLNTHMDYMALANSMNYYSDSRDVVEVVIPEGYTCAQIFRLLESEDVCTAAELEEYAANGELDDYWFLEGVTRGTANCLEGFLFPDTYQFYTYDDPERVLEKFLDNFDYRFNDDLTASIDELNARLSEMMADNGYSEEEIQENQLTVYEVVTVASLIEKETANTLESYTISSVIYNRLFNWGDTPAFLNIDAAILYALGEHKEELTVEDLSVDSPYNTYLYTGLPPSAICNPGLYSLNAALDPDDTDYYFYAMDPDTGAHHFSETEAGHNDFLASLEDED